MRYKELFKEAPISDFKPMGDYGDEVSYRFSYTKKFTNLFPFLN